MGDIDQLVWALQTGDLEEVKNKVLTAEDANRTLQGGRMPLHYASDYGQTDVVEFLISKGAEVNAVDKHGLTPLMAAIYENHINCVKVLLEKGADTARRGPGGTKVSEMAETEAMRALFQ